jgi:iron(III) transport system substrate-binding protein
LSYEDLSSSKWEKKLSIRSSNNLYNQSLVAAMIAKYGESFTESWAKGLVNNFARKPQGNDRAQIIAVANGEADLAIANSYYLGLMLSGKKGEKQLSAAKKVKILFPSQNEAGAHINISGAGIIKSSKNYNNAIQFLEFMLSEKAQKHLVENTYEYPINKKVKPSTLISQFGLNFKEDFTDVYKYGEFNSAAIKLMDRIGWE